MAGRKHAVEGPPNQPLGICRRHGKEIYTLHLSSLRDLSTLSLAAMMRLLAPSAVFLPSSGKFRQ